MKLYSLIIIAITIILVLMWILKDPYPPKYFYSDSKAIELCNSISAGNKQKIEKLLSQGVDINVKGKEGMTPLLWALKNKNRQMYEFVLQKGGNPNIKITSPKAPRGSSVFSIICRAQKGDYLKLTLKYGWKPQQKDMGRYGLLNTAIRSFSLDKVKLLIQAGADVNKGGSGNPPIIMAGILNQWHIVYYLLQHGADPTLTDDSGMSIVYLIERRNVIMSRKGEAYQYLLKCAKFLKDKGIEVDVSKPQKYPEPDL